MTLLRDPTLNKSTAFTDKERDALGLRGLLPPRVHDQDAQVARVLRHYHTLTDDLDKFMDLTALHDRNEALFFRVSSDNADEMLPIIYTPTVGLACERFGHVFQRSRGLYVSANDRGRVESLMRNWPKRKVGIIMVTDGERILGLGDLGANGMGIPVGKLAIYTACAGVHPDLCLPVTLDVGTDNDSLLNDPLYIGIKQKRLRGAAYDKLVDEFVMAVQKVFPGVVIQFEDFANTNAFRVLQRYRERVCAFNDDIQGTAGVTLGGLYSALRISGGTLADQRILCLGAGEAATGICELVASAMTAQGLSLKEAREHCWLVDSRGLVIKSRTDLAHHKLPFAHEHAPVPDFPSAIEALKPTTIIGVAAVGGTFTRPVLEAMARINQRPIIFALSNPTSKSECTAEEAYRATGGRAIFACGSPFDPVTLDGQTFVPRQCNNSYVFPGVGLGLIASGARHVTDNMFSAAAQALANQVTAEDLAQGSLFPSLTRVRDVSLHIAVAVAEVAYKQGLAAKRRPSNLTAYIKSQMYDPHYASYV
ncbi:MAG: NAD-dependent malic enzyme [Betaproteobacteria bacterium]|nr:NAD-dependent malic enzyme [Betaproteobacteria bacterium]